MSFNIVTFNIRYRYRGDGINSFINRAGMIYDKIKKEMPDIIAFQEMVPESLEFMQRVFPEYIITGHGRTTNYSSEGVFTAIKTSTLQLVGNEVLWIGPDPYMPESKFEGQSPCPRTLNITTVRRKADGKMIRIFNVHLDERTASVRAMGMKMVLDTVKSMNEKYPMEFVILGDFNAKESEETISLCEAFPGMKDVTKGLTYTFHDFGKQKESKIDYIYLSEGLFADFEKLNVWDDEENGIFLSDHYPLCAELKL